jgi:hypothetical protein
MIAMVSCDHFMASEVSMPYRSIYDDPFSATVTLAEAYRVLVAFVEQYNARGESSTVSLMTDVGLVHEGQSADPAQLDDFLRCARNIMASRSTKDA